MISSFRILRNFDTFLDKKGGLQAFLAQKQAVLSPSIMSAKYKIVFAGNQGMLRLFVLAIFTELSVYYKTYGAEFGLRNKNF